MQPWHLWVITAVVLMMLELLGAHFVLFGLGLAAVVVAVVAAAAPGMGLTAQLLVFMTAALVILPAIIVTYRRYYPANVISVMNEPGGSAGQPHQVVERDGRVGVEIYGDFYPAEFPTSGLKPQPGTQVVVQEFRGIVALVKEVSSTTEKES